MRDWSPNNNWAWKSNIFPSLYTNGRHAITVLCAVLHIILTKIITQTRIKVCTKTTWHERFKLCWEGMLRNMLPLFLIHHCHGCTNKKCWRTGKAWNWTSTNSVRSPPIQIFHSSYTGLYAICRELSRAMTTKSSKHSASLSIVVEFMEKAVEHETTKQDSIHYSHHVIILRPWTRRSHLFIKSPSSRNLLPREFRNQANGVGLALFNAENLPDWQLMRWRFVSWECREVIFNVWPFFTCMYHWWK